jgi:hypothetical protein
MLKDPHEITIQQDGATSHIDQQEPAFVEAATTGNSYALQTNPIPFNRTSFSGEKAPFFLARLL